MRKELNERIEALGAWVQLTGDLKAAVGSFEDGFKSVFENGPCFALEGYSPKETGHARY